ncbi:MAG: hypothetical protein QW376_07410 [Candidatus Caldarchaeum sp.]
MPKGSVDARRAIIDADILIEIIDRNIAEKLSLLFSTIYVPMAVKGQLKKHRKRYNLKRLLATGIFKKCTVHDEYSVQSLQQEPPKLDPGESHAIIQAQEKNISVFLTNERKARKVAQRYGLLVITFRELEQALQELASQH